MTRLGYFSKFLDTIFVTKVGQKLGYFFGFLKNHYSLRNNCGGFFLDIIIKIGLLFTPASGYTGGIFNVITIL